MPRLIPLSIVGLAALFTASLLHAQDTTPPSNPELHALLQPYVDNHSIPGAVVVVATKDKILAEECVGYANIAAQKPMEPDNMFAIASMSKPVCSTAVMMLVDQGKLSVDDPVEKYLPEFAGQMYIAEKDADHVLLKKPTRPVLIRDILSHTSGLPYASAAEWPKLPNRPPSSFPLDSLPLEMAVRTYAMTPLQFDPGTKFSYASAGINTAARIVEVVSGEPYEKFIEENIFQPLGMKDTTFWPTEEEMPRVATIYWFGPDKKTIVEDQTKRFTYPLSDHTHRYPIPASGLFSTAGDMLKFCQMYLNGGTVNGHTYLSQSSLQAMTSRQTPPGDKNSYGFGWVVDKNAFSHGGSYHTFMKIYPKLGIITLDMTQWEGTTPPGAGKLNPALAGYVQAHFKGN